MRWVSGADAGYWQPSDQAGGGDFLADGSVPMSGNLDVAGNAIILDADSDSKIDVSVDDTIDFVCGGTVNLRLQLATRAYFLGNEVTFSTCTLGAASAALRPDGVYADLFYEVTEQASIADPQSGSGSYWVRTDGVPLFTNDASEDYALIPEFAHIELTADQSANLGVGNHIEFDSIDQRYGSHVSLGTGAGQLDGLMTVAAGLYEIELNVRVQFSTQGVMTLELRDNADDSAIADVHGVTCALKAASPGSASTHANQSYVKWLVVLSASTVIKVDIQSNTGSLTDWEAGSNIKITRISPDTA